MKPRLYCFFCHRTFIGYSEMAYVDGNVANLITTPSYEGVCISCWDKVIDEKKEQLREEKPCGVRKGF